MIMETAVIAGVGPGLGASLARAFASKGFALALISRNPQSSEPVAAEIRSMGAPVIVVPADVGGAVELPANVGLAHPVGVESGQPNTPATLMS